MCFKSPLLVTKSFIVYVRQVSISISFTRMRMRFKSGSGRPFMRAILHTIFSASSILLCDTRYRKLSGAILLTHNHGTIETQRKEFICYDNTSINKTTYYNLVLYSGFSQSQQLVLLYTKHFRNPSTNFLSLKCKMYH